MRIRAALIPSGSTTIRTAPSQLLPLPHSPTQRECDYYGDVDEVEVDRPLKCALVMFKRYVVVHLIVR